MSVSQKPRRTYVSPLRKELDIAKARLNVLETACLHWYVPVKNLDSPCKQCGLALGDSIHKDRSV
jgi:hypothetical protein